MNATDRKKLAQLSRRLKAAQARYRSLEKRSGLIEEKRRALEEKAGRLFDLLMGERGKRAGSKRRLSLATQFKQAKDKAQKLRGLEDKIYQQLKDAEEKAATLEDNMRKASRKNPGRKHLPGATAKQDRQYEHIKETELKRGESKKEAKRIAAATVRARKNTKRQPSPAQLRARKKFAAMAKARARLARAKRRNASATQVLKKAGRAAKGAVRATLDAGSKLLKAGAKALGNPRKRIKVRNSYIDLVIKGQAKKTPSGWKVGRKTFSQGRGTTKVSSSYYLDKATGFVYAKRERANPTRKGMRKLYREAKRISKITRGRYFSSESGQRKAARHEKRHTRKRANPTFATVGIHKKFKVKQSEKSVSKAQRGKVLTKIDQAYAKDAQGYQWNIPWFADVELVATNPKRRRNLDHKDSGHQVHVHQHWRSGGLSQWQRAAHAGQRDLFGHGIKVKPKRNKSKKRNASPKTIRKRFAGRVGAGKTLFFPVGTPQGLAKLGRLKLIKTRKGTIKPARRNPAGEVWLCADTRGKLHLGTTSQAPLFNGPAQNLGEVTRVEYEESKPHLGYGPTVWFHKMGEEGGRRPTLYSDGQGGLCFKGGAYKIKREGIVG